MLLTLRCRRAPSEKAVICFCHCLYKVFSHILGVSLPPSACSNPLCRHPPPSSEGGEGAPAPCAELTHCGKEDSNERNPSGVSFVLVQVAFALQRRGEGAPAPCIQSPLWHSHIKICPPCAHIYYSLFNIHHLLFILQNVPAWRAHFRVNFRKQRNFVSPICVRCRRQPLSAGRDYREQDPRLRQRSQEHFLLCKPACRSLWKPACRCCAAGFRRR